MLLLLVVVVGEACGGVKIFGGWWLLMVVLHGEFGKLLCFYWVDGDGFLVDGREWWWLVAKGVLWRLLR